MSFQATLVPTRARHLPPTLLRLCSRYVQCGIQALIGRQAHEASRTNSNTCVGRHRCFGGITRIMGSPIKVSARLSGRG
jgi:hypothetical protein